MSLLLNATSPRVPQNADLRIAEEDSKFFREFRLKVHLLMQAVILKALEASGVLECYENFDLNLQIRKKKIDGFEFKERPPLLRRE